MDLVNKTQRIYASSVVTLVSVLVFPQDHQEISFQDNCLDEVNGHLRASMTKCLELSHSQFRFIRNPVQKVLEALSDGKNAEKIASNENMLWF